MRLHGVRPSVIRFVNPNNKTTRKKPKTKTKTSQSHSRITLAIASPEQRSRTDGNVLATSSTRGIAHLWDPDNRIGPLRSFRTEPGYALSCIAISPDGITLTAGDYDGYIWRWDIPSGAALPRLNAHEKKTIRSVCVQPRRNEVRFARKRPYPKDLVVSGRQAINHNHGCGNERRLANRY